VYVGNAFIEGFKEIGPYIGIVLPFSIAASFLDLMCLVSAQKAGDPYPIREVCSTAAMFGRTICARHFHFESYSEYCTTRRP